MATKLERIQAPFGGLNKDASPDYVPATQAPILTNLLSGLVGKVSCRGPIAAGLQGATTTATNPAAIWARDDTALLVVDSTIQSVAMSGPTATDLTATIGQTPANSAHARYGASVYGAITNANSPALGKWSGNTITLQTNAPFQFKDVQVYAQRLFVLGGSLPGTATPILNGGRILYWTDANTASDLTLTASWTDDVSALVNQLQYDGDDTPIALAGCGKYMAILGSRSINILTGSGSSSFAVRNLTRNWGVVDRNSVVEVDDGFYFLSDRGYCFCDGSTVRVVSDGAVTQQLVGGLQSGAPAVAFNNGYIAVSDTQGGMFLFHIPSQTWTQVTSRLFTSNTMTPGRSNTYPFIWCGKDLWSCDKITQPFGAIRYDSFGGTLYGIPALWRSRAARLGAPSSKATVERIILDHMAEVFTSSAVQPGATGWTVKVLDETDTVIVTASLATQQGISPSAAKRQRAQVECYAELDTLQLEISWDYTSPAPEMLQLDLYDAWIEYTPAQNTAGF